MTTRPRGKCRGCEQHMSLRADGTVRNHKAPGDPSVCAGVGKRPRGLQVYFDCLTDSHGTCGGHDGTAPKPCECPDESHHVEGPRLGAADQATSSPEAIAAELNTAEPGEEPVWTPVPVPDALKPPSEPGEWINVGGSADGIVRVTPRQTGKTSGYTPWLTDEENTLELTDEERRRIIAAHREKYPDAALEACRAILEGRLTRTDQEAP